MKTAILITDSHSQVVLEPETPAEQAALAILSHHKYLRTIDTVPITLRKGGFMMADRPSHFGMGPTETTNETALAFVFEPPQPEQETPAAA
jgi:hypothetical protein